MKSTLILTEIARCALLQVSGVCFSPAHEILWAGTESGGIYGLQSPSLERYCSVRCALTIVFYVSLHLITRHMHAAGSDVKPLSMSRERSTAWC